MRRVLGAIALIAAVVGVLALGNRASATNAIMDDFTTAYPATAGTALDSCSTCHTSVPTLNSYGLAVRSSGFDFAGIGGLDSDGDGFSNLQEIQALTKPGDASDHPPVATTSTTTTTTTNPTSPTSTTSTTSTTQPAMQSVSGSPVPGPSGAMAFDAGPAGTVWLTVDNGRLVVSKVDTSWSYEIEEEFDDDGHEIEIKFRSGETEVEFEAELEHGKIETEVEIEHDDDHDDDGDHGSDDHGDDHDDNHSKYDDEDDDD